MSEAREEVLGEGPEVRRGGGGPPSVVGRAAILVGVAAVGFLLGLVPMWLKARANADERDAARRELRVSRMQNTLASAAADAQRGEYEPARQAASEFFKTLSEQSDAGASDSALTPAQRDGLRPLLAQRDDLITLLARSDPASSARLFDLYAAFRKAVPASPAEGARVP